jgi:hypothetical protein
MSKSIFAISIIPEISGLFKNPTVDYDSLGITSETDFMMGAIWASCIDYFNDEYRNRYHRRPTQEKQYESILAIYERRQEIRQSIQEKLIL